MRWIVPLLLAAAAPAHAASTQITSTQITHSESGDGMSYVLMTGNGNSMMSGSSDDFRRAEAYRAGNGPLLYVRQGGTAYVIRDPALLRRAEAIVAPQQELGRRQGALGRQQGALGRQQGAWVASKGGSAA
jgi:hypothetical protein